MNCYESIHAHDMEPKPARLGPAPLQKLVKPARALLICAQFPLVHPAISVVARIFLMRFIARRVRHDGERDDRVRCTFRQALTCRASLDTFAKRERQRNVRI